MGTISVKFKTAIFSQFCMVYSLFITRLIKSKEKPRCKFCRSFFYNPIHRADYHPKAINHPEITSKNRFLSSETMQPLHAINQIYAKHAPHPANFADQSANFARFSNSNSVNLLKILNLYLAHFLNY
jgi:hypothetical protein